MELPLTPVKLDVNVDGKIRGDTFEITHHKDGSISGKFSNDLFSAIIGSDPALLCNFQSEETISDCRNRILTSGVTTPQYQYITVTFNDGRSPQMGQSTSTTSQVLPRGNKFYEESNPKYDLAQKYSIICLEE